MLLFREKDFINFSKSIGVFKRASLTLEEVRLGSTKAFM
jgi:hypothetical protein